MQGGCSVVPTIANLSREGNHACHQLTKATIVISTKIDNYRFGTNMSKQLKTSKKISVAAS